MNTRSFTTDRLILRNFQIDDWRSMHEIASNPEVARFMEWKPGTEEDTQRYIAQTIADRDEDPRTSFRFAAVLKDSGDFAGACWLHISDMHTLEASIGYVVHPDFWGQGFATEIAGSLLAFGFGELGLHRIIAYTDPANIPSARVLEKISMRREGHLREHVLSMGQWRDSWLYAILDHEWQQTHRNG